MSVPYIQARDPLGLMLAEAGSNFGTGLGQGIKNKQQQSVIDNVLKNSSKIDETGRTVVDPERMFAGLTRSGAFTPQEVQERVKPFSDQRESELTRRSKFKDVPDTQEFKGLLQSLGYDEEKADELSSLYNSLSVGGKTFFGKSVVEQIQRSGGFDTSRSNQRGGQGSLEGGSQQLHPPALQGENIDQVDATEEDTFQWPEINNFKDLTPAEKTKKRDKLLDEGKSVREQILKNRTSLKSDQRRIKTLTNLNDRKNLPEGLSRWNVDLSEGTLRLPAAANTDTQSFVKNLNEWVESAKDSFGARVTDFDLKIFMRKLPTLLNSEGGRRVILKQMEVINKLNNLHNEALNSVYNQYGNDTLDSLQADNIARSLTEKDEDALFDQYLDALNAEDQYQENAAQQKKIDTIKQSIPEGKVLIRVNGTLGTVSKEELESLDDTSGIEIL